MTHRMRVQCPGRRPSLNALTEELWGAHANIDSDGDSASPDDDLWTELTLENRHLPDSRIDVDPVATDPLILEVRGKHRELLERVARLLVQRSGGRLLA